MSMRLVNALIALGIASAQLLFAAWIVQDFTNAGTFRFYLDHRIGAPPTSAVVQRFDIEGRRVVPKIVTRGPDTIGFDSHVGRDSTLESELRVTGPTAYQIRWMKPEGTQTIAEGVADAPISVSARVPTGDGRIELIANGAATWIDPRVVNRAHTPESMAVFALLIIGAAAWRRSATGTPGVFTRNERFGMVATSITLVIALAAAEVALRATSAWLPAGIQNQRHDLGEVARDERWIDSPRYDRRLRPLADLDTEWRDGDIIRLGYVPAIVGDGDLHHYRFQTDAEGFRNAGVRTRFDIAALGDSFTDAQTMTAEASWPPQLAKRLGVSVQNYGTATYGPQQELMVLQDFVAGHHPSRVVLAYFAGNDLFDAEAFDEFMSSGRKRDVFGWPIRNAVTRADSWFITSTLRAGAGFLLRNGEGVAQAAAPAPRKRVPDHPSFDRGMFSVPAGEGALMWALMPPYLNTMTMTERELESRRGWALTRDALRDMQRVSHSFGAEFIVMFLPFKSQVYWPRMQRAFPPRELIDHLSFYFDGDRSRFNLEGMGQNRLAQNRMMQRFCAEAGIPFVDTTDALVARVNAGDSVYPPSESHLNELGQSIVADTLAGFLSQRPK
jgi:lysophospholipase L1-like esterase